MKSTLVRGTRGLRIAKVVSTMAISVTLVGVGLSEPVLAVTAKSNHHQARFYSPRIACMGMDLTYVTTSPGDSVGIPLNGTVNATVDWGDGNITNTSTPMVGHTYASAGTYDVCVTGTVTHFGLGWTTGSDVGFAATGSNYLSSVNSWGSLGTTSLLGAFMGASNLTHVPDTLPSTVTDISYMFDGDTSFNQPIDTWDTSHVTLMLSVFNGATSFDQPLNGWNTSSVTDAQDMFADATGFDQPLNAWNTAQLTDISGMFAASAFNQNIDDWNVSAVTSFSSLFFNDAHFNQPLDNWSLSQTNAFSLDAMFMYDPVFNQPLNAWNTVNAINISFMFYGDTAFNQDLSSWNTSSVSGMDGFNGMFNSSGLSPQNYDSFLISAASRPESSDENIGASGVYYCAEAIPARTALTLRYSWVFSDAGQGTTQCSAPSTSPPPTSPPPPSPTTTTTDAPTTTTTISAISTTTTTSPVAPVGPTTSPLPQHRTTRRTSISMSATASPELGPPNRHITLMVQGLPRTAKGAVHFVSGKMPLCSAKVSRGEASCMVTRPLGNARYTVRAIYSGDSKYLPRTVVTRFQIT